MPQLAAEHFPGVQHGMDLCHLDRREENLMPTQPMGGRSAVRIDLIDETICRRLVWCIRVELFLFWRCSAIAPRCRGQTNVKQRDACRTVV